MIAVWDAETGDDILTLLPGDAIVAVHLRDPAVPQDPVFLLESGRALEIHADTDLDPWRFRIGDDHIFIGPLVPMGES